MFLNKTYEEWLAKALEFEKGLKETDRTPSFFPRLWPTYKVNPSNPTGSSYFGGLVVDILATPGAAENWYRPSHFCCGLMELSLSHQFFSNFHGRALPDLQRMNLAYVLNQVSPVTLKMGNSSYGRGFIFWCGTDHDSHGKVLKEFGFTKFVDFLNTAHNHHLVEVLGCSTGSATEHAKKTGEITKWPAGSTMRAAQIAAPATT